MYKRGEETWTGTGFELGEVPGSYYTNTQQHAPKPLPLKPGVQPAVTK